MNISEKFVEHCLETEYEDLDSETIQRTKTRILDTLGVIVIGSKGILCDSVLDLLQRKGGREEATVLGFGAKLPATSAAMVNALMARSFDFDPVMALMDNGRNKPAHISACSVSASLAAAECNSSSGKELICALALGDDLAARLVGFSGGGPQDVFDNTGIASGMSAVTACAKLYNLNAREFKNALGIMVNSVSGSMRNSDEYSMSFKFPIANAARNAIFAVELAKAGFESVDDPLCGPKTYFDTYGADYNIDHFLDSMGSNYLSDIVIKPWASCRMTHAGIDAVLMATRAKPIDPDDIESFNLFVHPKSPGFIIEDFQFGDTSQVHGAFNLRFTASVAALFGAVRPEHYTNEIMLSEPLRKMLGEITCSHDENLPSTDTAAAQIALKDGRILSAQVSITPLGDMLHNPLSESDIEDKFLLNLKRSGMISQDSAILALDLIRSVENQSSLASIVSLLS